LGGRICLEIALRYPERVRRLVLVDAAGFGKLTLLGKILGAAAWGVRKIVGQPQPYPAFLREEGEDGDWMCLDELSALKVPTLIVWNRYDPYYPLTGAFRAVRLIPKARLAVFPGYGHAPHVKERNTFNRLLQSFLDHK
jgi:pimeloyl-ACP methyl ester carboxylesterase